MSKFTLSCNSHTCFRKRRQNENMKKRRQMNKPILSTSSLSLTQSKGCEQHVFDHKRGKVNLVLDLFWISIFPLEESNKRTEKALWRSPSSWAFNLFAVPTIWSVSSTTRQMSSLIKRSCSLISGKKEKKKLRKRKKVIEKKKAIQKGLFWGG